MLIRPLVIALFLFSALSAMGQASPPSGSTLFYGIPQLRREMVNQSQFDIAGPWKLPRIMAYRYGLIVEEGYDERLDTLRAFPAARKYYKHLEGSFGEDALWAYLQGSTAYRKHPIDSLHKRDWTLALSGYGRTERSLARSHQYDTIWGPQIWPKASSFDSFFEMNPAITGNVLDSIPLVIRVDSVSADWDSLWSENQKASYVFLKEKRDVKSLEAQAEAKERAAAKEKPKPVVYKVKSGDNLGGIARRYGVSIRELKSWNNLRSDMIRIGQALTVFPTRERKAQSVPKSSSKEPKAPTRSQSSKPKEKPDTSDGISYIVQPGETLWSIARQFENLTPDDIMKYNGISENIRAGDEIKIPPTAKKKKQTP